MRKELEAIRNMTPEEKEENRQKLLSPSQIKEVLYHATPKNFKKFKPGGDDIKKSGHGIWLSMVAERQPAMHNISGRGDDLFKHGTNVMPVHVQSRTPLVLDSQEMDDCARNAFAGGSGNFPYMMPKEWADAVQAEGYDSIYNPRSKEVVMFDPTKIKSAIGNRGTYDTTRADITKAGGGSIDQMRYECFVPTDEFYTYLQGEKTVGLAMPSTNVGDREFLMTGTSPQGWKKMWGK